MEKTPLTLFSTTPQGKNSSQKPILITVVCGLLLAVGSCYGFLNTAGDSSMDPVTGTFSVLFVLGVVCFLGGLLYLFLRNIGSWEGF